MSQKMAIFVTTATGTSDATQLQMLYETPLIKNCARNCKYEARCEGFTFSPRGAFLGPQSTENPAFMSLAGICDYIFARVTWP
jgi:hypothetical protein